MRPLRGGYQISGVLVSDFITPHFYDSVATPGSPYSFTGAIQRPRQILPGGYISFVNLQSDELQQILWLGATPQLRDLGPADGKAKSMRGWVHGGMGEDYEQLHQAVRQTDSAVAQRLNDRRRTLDEIGEARVKRYLADVH
jgi:hypothetical protein